MFGNVLSLYVEQGAVSSTDALNWNCSQWKINVPILMLMGMDVVMSWIRHHQESTAIFNERIISASFDLMKYLRFKKKKF